jgi:hypothetical protein
MQAIARNVRTSEQTGRHLWQGCQQKKETQVTAGLLAIEGTPAIGDTLAKGGTPETEQEILAEKQQHKNIGRRRQPKCKCYRQFLFS